MSLINGERRGKEKRTGKREDGKSRGAVVHPQATRCPVTESGETAEITIKRGGTIDGGLTDRNASMVCTLWPYGRYSRMIGALWTSFKRPNIK